MLLYPYICNADSPYIYGVDLMGNNDDIVDHMQDWLEQTDINCIFLWKSVLFETETDRIMFMLAWA